MRIFICGASGAGKSTLAKRLSEELNIPFVDGSSKVLWEKYGITNHLGLITKSTLDPIFGLEFQEELLRHRNQVTQGVTNFVTDRTPIDNWVYFLLQMLPYTTDDQVIHYKETCKASIRPTDFYILLKRPEDTPLEDDHMRIPNRLYQSFVSELFEGIIVGNDSNFSIEIPHYRVIKSNDIQEKLNIILPWIKKH